METEKQQPFRQIEKELSAASFRVERRAGSWLSLLPPSPTKTILCTCRTIPALPRKHQFMNYLKYLLCTALLSTSLVSAQTVPTAPSLDKPFVGANLITLVTADNLPAAMAIVRRVLQTQGYALDSVGPDRLITKSRSVSSKVTGGTEATLLQVFRVRLFSTSQGSRLAITGEYSQDLGPKYHFTFPMRWLGPQNPSDNQACFQQADAIAKAYPRGTVSYAQQP